VVEDADIDLSPFREVMALQAVGSESSLMPVFMTVAAGRRNSQKGFAQILDLYGQALSFGYPPWGVAAVTP
jgi:hypothetical protein